MSKEYWKPGNMLYPVPAVMVSCGREGEKPNIITVAWAGTICSDPAMVSISVRKERYSHDIIKETGEFVINLVNKRLVRATDYCGVKSGRDVDKFAETRLTPQASRYVKAPGIEESPVNIECKVTEVKELGSHDMFLAKVVGVTIDNQYMDDRGKFNLNASGLTAYSHGEYFELGKKLGSFGYSVRKPAKKKKTMIGMPSSGKSTVGVLLAKRLGFSFIDVDIVIQEKEGRLLKEIIADEGMDGFLEVENRINAGLEAKMSVIAPGGSVIYGEEAMAHLKEISEIVYLKMSYEEMEKRIGNVVDRGVALKPGFTLRDLYNERVPYYEKYADIVIDEEGKNAGETVDELRNIIEGMMDQKMIQMFIDEQKRKLEERDRLLSEKDEEIRQLKARIAQLEGK